MKKKFLTLTVLGSLWLTNTAIAQNWTVGVPVHQQIIDLPVDIEVTAFCDSMSGQEAEFRIPLPVVSGVSYYVHVDNAIPSTDSFKLIHNGITQILGLGDSMLIVPVATTPCIQFGQPCEVIKLSYNGPVPQLISSYASLKFMAVGTPTVAGENYPLSPCNAWFNQGIGCMFPHYVAQIDMLTGDTCFTTTNTVKSTTSIGEIIETKACLYPNPTNGVIYLNTDASFIGQNYIIIDYLGRQVLSGKISSRNTVIELNNLTKGIYLLNIADMKKQNFKVIKE
jgi:hypothetical protein